MNKFIRKKLRKKFKLSFGFSLMETLVVMALLAMLFAFAIAAFVPLKSEAQQTPTVYQPNFYKTLTFATANTNQTLTPSFSDTIRPNMGEGIYIQIWATNATTANVTFKLDPTVDGTLWTSNSPIQFAMALNSTTPVTLFTNIDRAYINNARAVKLTSIANGHTNGIFGVVEFSHGNQ